MSCCNKGWVAISGAGPSGPEPALPGPGNSEMQDKIPHIIKSLWPESLEEHLPINIAGVLRLRATSVRQAIGLRGASLRMTDFVRGLRNIRLVVRKIRKIERGTGSPNDTRGGSGSATNPLKPKKA